MFKSLFKKTTIFKVNGKTINTDTPEGKAALEKFDKEMDEFGERMDEFSASIDKTFKQMDDSFSTLSDTIEKVEAAEKVEPTLELLDQLDQYKGTFNWELSSSWLKPYTLKLWIRHQENGEPAVFHAESTKEVIQKTLKFIEESNR